jgi:hypothetical protein
MKHLNPAPHRLSKGTKTKIIMKKITLLTVMSFMFVIAANAQTATPKVDKRQEIQKERITNGVQNGELTRQETRMIAREQRHIRRVERRAEADGIVTGRERARLDRKQDRASRHIARTKHNPRSRY